MPGWASAAPRTDARRTGTATTRETAGCGTRGTPPPSAPSERTEEHAMRSTRGLALAAAAAALALIAPTAAPAAVTRPVVITGPAAAVTITTTTLAGTLSGTGNAGRAVRLQQNAFPFTAGFANAGNPQLTDAAGHFAFPVVSVALTTQYRVIVVGRPAVASPVVTVAPLVALTTKVSRHRVVRGHRVRFSGKVRPAIVIPMVIQKRGRHGLWRNIATTVSRPAGDHATYGKSVRI